MKVQKKKNRLSHNKKINDFFLLKTHNSNNNSKNNKKYIRQLNKFIKY